MVLTDLYLNTVADNSSTLSNYGSVSTSTDVESDPTVTSLDGEIGSRSSLSSSVTDNVLSLSFIRSGASVVNTAGGDSLTAVALFDNLTGGDIHQLVTLPSLLHTTSFDIEFETQLTFGRR